MRQGKLVKMEASYRCRDQNTRAGGFLVVPKMCLASWKPQKVCTIPGHSYNKRFFFKREMLRNYKIHTVGGISFVCSCELI